eukprot:TRINITY_DN1364_c0_g1_i2.p1 TRINITY_DN1364_c0_g1~~TRINITY_DN1364_c0_g1_i2.p1  ORF type:complete len:419 (-),score=126.73 TRINITY_DN1364_c0_g1_i2:909-2096(-)
MADLWGIARSMRAEEQGRVEGRASQSQSDDSSSLSSTQNVHVLVIGGRQSGKTTIARSLLRQKETEEREPRPSVALEYSSAVRENDMGGSQLVHVWELAGGVRLANLLDVVLRPSILPSLVVMVVVDLSHPASVFQTLLFWLGRIQKRISEITPFEGWKQRHFGEAHRDFGARLPAIGVPTVIVANKYDALVKAHGFQKSTMARTLRYVAHTHGCSLVYHSKAMRKLLSVSRAFLVEYVMGSASRQVELSASVVPSGVRMLMGDMEKPVVVWAGADSLADIGDPDMRGLDAHFDRPLPSTGDPALDGWQMMFVATFVRSDEDGKDGKDRGDDDDGLDGLDGTHDAQAEAAEFRKTLLSKYAEPTIDALWMHKLEELESHRTTENRKDGRVDDDGM